MPTINFGEEKYYYIGTRTPVFNNGLRIIRAGETFPSPLYYHERSETFGEGYGGLYVFEYVRKGCGYIECDGERIKVCAGDFYFLNRFHAHKYYSDKNDPYEKVWINATGPFLNAVSGSLGLDRGYYVIRFNAGRQLDEICCLLDGMEYEQRQRVFDRSAVLLTELLLRINAAKNNEDAETGGIVYEIKKYIDSGHAPAVTLDDICAKFFLNKSYFINLFKSAFRVTPHRYILTQKIETAKELLASNAMPMKEISEFLGFASPQYLCSVFSRETGMTPGEYRRSVQK